MSCASGVEGIAQIRAYHARDRNHDRIRIRDHQRCDGARRNLGRLPRQGEERAHGEHSNDDFLSHSSDHNDQAMPELPDVTVYVEALQQRIVGQTLTRIRLASPFLLRTVEPAPSDLAGKKATGVRRMGKRIVIELEGENFIVIHLMIAGRFKWLAAGAKVPGKVGLAAFDFTNGTLLLTEAGSKRRASLHLVRGEDAVRALDPGDRKS